jgi:glycosyltransferase Alg8
MRCAASALWAAGWRPRRVHIQMTTYCEEAAITKAVIGAIEADHLDHWLWGRFRILSGDDKSTRYHFLSKRAKMIYVPAAMVSTVEVIKGAGMRRMVQNFRRWSGNMLRIGSRAITLGPRACLIFPGRSSCRS